MIGDYKLEWKIICFVKNSNEYLLTIAACATWNSSECSIWIFKIFIPHSESGEEWCYIALLWWGSHGFVRSYEILIKFIRDRIRCDILDSGLHQIFFEKCPMIYWLFKKRRNLFCTVETVSIGSRCRRWCQRPFWSAAKNCISSFFIKRRGLLDTS